MENIRIKGFDKELKCRGFQFEVGKEYKIESTDLKLCTYKVFHYCESLREVNNFYPVDADNRFCYIEVLGKEVREGDKWGSNHIKVLREIVGEELKLLLGRVNGNTGYFNSGNRNTGHWNSGYGNSGHGNSGSWNSGNRNSGYGNSGHGNSGHGNSGNWNSGDNNSGNWNSGSYNSGDCNSGNFNRCDYSNGFFCAKEPKAIVFDIETDMTVSEFRSSKYYHAMMSSNFILKGLKGEEPVKYTYKEACKNWWQAMTPENKEIIKSMPNFDAKIFKKITGVTIKNKKEE